MEDNQPGESGFRIGEWSVDPSTNRLRQGQREVRLEPKTMAVLVYLASRSGLPVSRSELEAAVWKDAVVGYDAVAGAIQKLRKVFDDDPAHPRVIETISKKGYRLVAPVSGSNEPPPHTVDPQQGTSAPARGSPRRVLPFAALAGLLLAGALLFLGYPNKERTSGISTDASAAKTLAVLPFQDLTADGTEGYFAEGMSDDLITSLAKFSDLRVISRDSSFLYKGMTLEPRELGQRLHARYLLRGNVQRQAERVRITAQLIDARTDGTLWAGKFDEDVSDIFELQDRITRRIVAALTGRMNVRDRQELGHPHTGNLQAYDHFLYGRQRFFLYASAEENRKARESFLRAIALDPEFALAHAMLAWTYAFDAMNGWSEPRRDSLERALQSASRAIASDEAMPVAYFVRGLAYRELGDPVHARVEAEKAIEYDPNYAGAHVLLATLLYFGGKPLEGLELIKKAMALNPNHPYNYSFHLGQALYILKRYDEAIEAFNDVVASNPGAERAHVWLAAALAQAGQPVDAEWEIEQVLAVNPEFSLEHARTTYPFRRRADLEHFLNGLRKAGLSEQHQRL